MRCWKGRLIASAAGLLLTLPTVTHAWNGTGHRAIAQIAYEQLDAPTRTRVAEVLTTHPAARSLWADRRPKGPNEELNLFGNASVFPDDARRPEWDKYNRPTEHYVNFRIFAEDGNRVAPPIDTVSVLTSYPVHVRLASDSKTPEEERAVHLSWIFHQVGDIHQPLHAVARFSKALPDGDRGGNGVAFSDPNPRPDREPDPKSTRRPGRTYNLHAYWDDLLGRKDLPADVDDLAKSLMQEYPKASFSAELEKTEIRDWAEESVQICLKTVYNNLDPNVTKFVDRPVGYDADAKRAARRRAALAGYRLGAELNRIFNPR